MIILSQLHRKPKTEFEKRLRRWQGKMYDKEAASKLGVKLTTYRHWKYQGTMPSQSKCLSCIESIINEK